MIIANVHEVDSTPADRILWEMPMSMVGQLTARAVAKHGGRVHRPLKYKEALAKLREQAQAS